MKPKQHYCKMLKFWLQNNHNITYSERNVVWNTGCPHLSQGSEHLFRRDRCVCVCYLYVITYMHSTGKEFCTRVCVCVCVTSRYPVLTWVRATVSLSPPVPPVWLGHTTRLISQVYSLRTLPPCCWNSYLYIDFNYLVYLRKGERERPNTILEQAMDWYLSFYFCMI